MKFRPTKQEALEAGKQYEYKRNSTVSYENRSSKPNKLFEKSVRELYGWVSQPNLFIVSFLCFLFYSIIFVILVKTNEVNFPPGVKMYHLNSLADVLK